MPRTAVPWQMRAVERCVEEQTLIAQAKREEQAIGRLIEAANLNIARAEQQIAAAMRIETNAHATLTRAEHEAFVLTGILDRATAEMVQA